jgi:hypothetical protein
VIFTRTPWACSRRTTTDQRASPRARHQARPLILGGTEPLLSPEVVVTFPLSAVNPLSDERAVTHVLELPAGTHAGTTLSRRDQGPGVAVTALDARDQAFACGLRVGDVLLAIDGAVLTEPAESTGLINKLTAGARRATLTVLPKAALTYEPARL